MSGPSLLIGLGLRAQIEDVQVRDPNDPVPVI